MPAENHAQFRASETPQARKRRRFVRRWKRRAQALAPLLGIPLVFGALALSMDLVRYVPNAQAVKTQAIDTRPRPIAQTKPIDRTPRSSTYVRTNIGQQTAKRKAPLDLDSLDSSALSLDLSVPAEGSAGVPIGSFTDRSRR